MTATAARASRPAPRPRAATTLFTAELGGPISGLSSFGEDGCGELYLVSYEGSIEKVVSAP